MSRVHATPAVCPSMLLLLITIGVFTIPSLSADERDAASGSETLSADRPAQANGPARDEIKQPAVPPRYITRRDHDPNGIGKFYFGREIAHVMGFQAAGWLERSEREKEEQLSLLVNSLKLKPGMVVADIGAGSGVISVLMAKQVGPKGKVLAVDIQDEMLVLLAEKLKARKITNVEPVLGTRMSPNLKPGSVDLAIMVDVYHEFDFPYEMIRELSKSLKPGGRIAFVEYRREDPKVRRMIKLVHTMTEAQVKREIGQPEFRLKWKETIGVLPVQHIIVFERLAATTKPAKSDR